MKQSLVSKLAEVMGAVDRVPKRGRNTFHGYDFATEADIAEALRGELAERHVMMIPRVVSWEFKDLGLNKKGEPKEPLTVMSMTFTFIDGETDERLEIPWVGAGQDGGDKGFYKAMTGAEKYVLLKTFLVPTGDDPETDSRNPESEKATGVPITVTKVDGRWEGQKGNMLGFVTLSDGRKLPVFKAGEYAKCQQLEGTKTPVVIEVKVGASDKPYLDTITTDAPATKPAAIPTAVPSDDSIPF